MSKQLILDAETQGRVKVWPCGQAGDWCIRLEGHNEQDEFQYLTLMLRSADVLRLRAFFQDFD